jgi:hypothetical protein
MGDIWKSLSVVESDGQCELSRPAVSRFYGKIELARKSQCLVQWTPGRFLFRA